ncbi:MAG: hypothetical protein HZB56_03740 [Deltaproteobacteria bacterium]|nr:hypothetical protein [Deltaproteobacteria bacterium]
MGPPLAITADELRELADHARSLDPLACAADAAQAIVDTTYDRLAGSLVLLRVFTTLPYSALSAADRDLVRDKCEEKGLLATLREATPVLTLLGTRGRRPEWNDRTLSRRFRCVPLISAAYVAAHSMLELQLRAMGFDLGLVDRWEREIAASGRADRYAGVLHVADAARELDEQGRWAVPARTFVAENGVRTVIGCGAGYARHPALATLFAFTSEPVERERAGPFMVLLDAYRELSEPLLARGAAYRQTPP